MCRTTYGTRSARINVQAGAPLPSNGQIGKRIVMPGVAVADCTAGRSEAVVYVAVGSAVVNVGHLGGSLATHQFVYVATHTPYGVTLGQDSLAVIFEMRGHN